MGAGDLSTNLGAMGHPNAAHVQAAIAAVHARGAYLSQAFARNLMHCPDGVIGFIDFEDDPGETLSIAECQARDWLSYLHSTALPLRASSCRACRLPRHH